MPAPSRPDLADIAACRALLRTGSRTFHAASLLLPRTPRDAATALFAFCRLADDAIDLDGERVDALRHRIACIYAGRPLPIPADRALSCIVAHHAIPRALPEALLDGFAWDKEARRYADMAALHDYAARVAGSVGAMMALLMGARDAEAIARACDLGVAMQLSNIARDVGEDARAGRLYLPLDWLAQAGVDAEAWLAAPVFTPAIGHVTGRVLAEADRLYARADAGIGRLPLACRPGIASARRLYAAIGHEVARRGGDGVSARAVVPGSRRVRASIVGAVGALHSPHGAPAPALEATRFLIEAAASAPAPWIVRVRRVEHRVEWLVNLFTRLEQRDQARASG